MAQGTLHKAFLIPEILENILLHTDMCTLLTSAQRVCHHWHNLITESHNLQAALFFKPTKRKFQEGSQTHSKLPHRRKPLALLLPQTTTYGTKGVCISKTQPTLRGPSQGSHIPSSRSKLETDAPPATTHKPHRNH
ncbi:hypothetical protein ASPWEDRAFT_46060 [Aspergillus wentii DTO 134E9]|uniref:F-box domain-containing protein n=1 Tax=Aspergillus wentii DTO 134E9 TaxID=1073089 RepID=A0A1L9R6C9_ASPWE|nr:uncharacterized protein ASPWEDRAFT_46060 [Aspergillus wentii DTO 134E9]OJJ30464.1 hypothetical protein ASPWEDRAFT_46060 [Aspergillus wentii DTO 134E9]